MFRIFRGYDGSLLMVPYEFGDELWGLGFLMIGIVLMFWLIAISAGLMYMPLLAVIAGLVLLLFMSSESASDARNISAYFFCFPFFAYGWTGMNWAMFAAATPKGAGLVAIIGWLISAAIALFVLVLPSFAVADSNAGGLVLIPLFFLWISAILFGVGDPGSDLAGNAENIVKYTFRVFGIMMLICLAVYIISAVKDLSKNPNARKGLAGGAAMFCLGLIPVAVAGLLGEHASPVIVAVLVLASYGVIAFLTYDREHKAPYPNARFVLLPMLLCWLSDLISQARQQSGELLVPLKGAREVVDFMSSDPMRILGERVGEPSLAGLQNIYSTAANFIVKLILRIFDAHIGSFSIPYWIVFVLGFLSVLLVFWIGTVIREKTAGAR